MFQKLKEKILLSIIKTTVKAYFFNRKTNKEYSYIPPSGKCIGVEELQNMIEASLDMWLTAGRFNKKFEQKIKDFLSVKYCLTVNSGSSANLLALSALTSPLLKERQLKKGDEVITVAAGFPTTINPIIMLGMVPVFVDCEIGTYNIKVDDIENAVTEKTKAVIIAHTLGNTFDLEKIKELCEKYNLWLIEDNCDALGSKYNDKFTGTIGDIGTLSFYPAHTITTGEGGAVITNNQVLKKIMQSFRDWGRDCCCETGHDNACNNRFGQKSGELPFGYDHKYVYSHAGYNFKMTDWQAAIGCAQMEKLNDFIEKRKRNFNLLYEKLSDLQEFLILPKATINSTPAWFGFIISVKENMSFTKQQLVEYLEENGIGTRQLFGGNILRQPYFVENDIKLRINNSSILSSKDLTENDYKLLPNTEFIMNNSFWVGVYPALGEREINKISNFIHTFIEIKNKKQ